MENWPAYSKLKIVLLSHANSILAIYTYLYLKATILMKRVFTSILVMFIMITGILGITNPGFRQPYKLFDNIEGKLTHNYFIFSLYQQHYGYSLSDNGKYIIYKRYIGIALNFFEISPLKEERE